MNQLNKDKAIINNFCKLLGINPRVSESDLKTFNEMQWDIDNEVHTFAFISCLSLIETFELPILSTSHYPENVIKAINTFKMDDEDKSLNDILTREFLIIDDSEDLAAILTHFTLTLLSVWKLKVNVNFI